MDDLSFLDDCLNMDLVYKINELKSIRESMRETKKIEEILRSEVEELIGTASQFVYEGEVICSFKEQENKRFDTERFKKEHPNLYEMFTKVYVTRPFRLKGD